MPEIKLRPIVFKVTPPEPFVMTPENASTSSTSGNTKQWYYQQPGYPEAYNGSGKQCSITISDDIYISNDVGFLLSYAGGSGDIRSAAFTVPATAVEQPGGGFIYYVPAGTYTGTLAQNNLWKYGSGNGFIVNYYAESSQPTWTGTFTVSILDP